MQHINRLLLTARAKQFNGKAKHILGWVEIDVSSGKWGASAQIWDGVRESAWNGGVKTITIEPQDTAEEAAKILNERLRLEYPKIEPLIFIEDIGI